jgi:MYXO-CTERM domain-containing protein
MPAATVLPKDLKDATSAHKVGTLAWIARRPTWVSAVLLAVAAVASVGCAAEASDQTVETRVTTGTTETRIFGGAKDDDSDAIPGVVALRVGTGSTFELCSGALIAPNVVLTARHCVTKNATSSVSCDENGRSANGRHVSEDEDPATIGVYIGSAPSFAKPPVSTGRAIVAPTGPYLCDSDIALLVLEKPIKDVAPLPVRIHSAARKGEMIRSVGYGQNDKSSPIGTRFRRAGVAVLAQGKAVSASKTPLGAHEFEVGQSICQGDSGGPAISEETGAIIGVVSRGGGCGDDFGHIYTTTAGFDSLFAGAFELSGAHPTVEDGDAPANGPSTRSKSTGPPGETAAAPMQTQAGCSVTPRSAATAPATAGVAVLAAAAALGARRRRRAS